MDWFLVKTKPNSDYKAQQNLINLGFKTFLPQYVNKMRKSSKFVSKLTLLLPSYIFVGVNSATKPFSQINSTIGVSSLVFFNNNPKLVSEKIIKNLKNHCDENVNL